MTDIVDTLLADWADERPELDWTPLDVVVRIQLLGKRLSQDAESVLADEGLKLWEYDVLSALRRQGSPYELHASELARMSMLTSGTVTTRIDGLQEAGLVRRLRDPSDRRAVRIRLTTRGLNTIDKAIERRLAAARSQLRSLSAGEKTAVSSSLRKLMVDAENGSRH